MSRSSASAHIALFGLVGWTGLILLLHALEPGFDPSRRMLSEYVLGEHGYLMRLAFVSLALGVVALAIGLLQSVRPCPRPGGGLMLFAGVMAFLAMVFDADLTTSGAARTFTGYLHIGLVVAGIVPICVAAALLSAVFRNDPRWSSVSKVTAWWAAAIIGATLIHFVTYWSDWRGLFQRADMAITTGWLFFIAVRLRKISGRTRQLPNDAGGLVIAPRS